MDGPTLERIADLDRRLKAVEVQLGLRPKPQMDAMAICDAKGVLGPGSLARLIEEMLKTNRDLESLNRRLSDAGKGA